MIEEQLNVLETVNPRRDTGGGRKEERKKNLKRGDFEQDKDSDSVGASIHTHRG